MNYFAKRWFGVDQSLSQTFDIIFIFTEKQLAENNQNILSFKQLFQESALKVGYMKNLSNKSLSTKLEQIIN